jgi:AraC family transcriptional regulator
MGLTKICKKIRTKTELVNHMKLRIKNMVCDRCILAVEEILHQEATPYHRVIYGEIHLQGELTRDQKERLLKRLNQTGFELIENHSTALIENIRQFVRKRARNENGDYDKKLTLSRYLSGKVNHEYTYLSSLFSSAEGRTIETYFIEQRIERAKELLSYGQMTLSQIAFELEYSSVAYLSNQFKKVTGLTPTYYRETGVATRKSLDKV